MSDDLGEPSRSGDRTALDRLLGVPEMDWLVRRVRARAPTARTEPLSGVVQLRDPTDAQRAAAVRLVGRPRRPGAGLRVDLAQVEQVLRRGPWPAGLVDAVETLTGPVVDHRAVRDQEAAEWDRARELMVPAIDRFPALGDWWQRWCVDGGLKRATRAEALRTSREPSPEVGAGLVRSVVEVLQMLPASGDLLAVLARRATGDAHALDAARPLGRLAAVCVAVAFPSEPAGASGASGDDGTGPSLRDTWAAAGVLLSGVSSTVLCLGVPGVRSPGLEEEETSSPVAVATGTALEAMRRARTPTLLTLQQVRSGGIRALPAGRVVRVCENPTVVEVVADLWSRAPGTSVEEVNGSVPPGPVLVCTSGQPSTAVLDLLTVLTSEGAECRYHGDFDWAGLRIARFLGSRVTWTPWRYRADDYVESVNAGLPSRRLSGDPVEAPWDLDLTRAMTEEGLAVEEEAMAELLAGDVLADG